jgi:hypothetical protein
LARGCEPVRCRRRNRPRGVSSHALGQVKRRVCKRKVAHVDLQTRWVNTNRAKRRLGSRDLGKVGRRIHSEIASAIETVERVRRRSAQHTQSLKAVCHASARQSAIRELACGLHGDRRTRGLSADHRQQHDEQQNTNHPSLIKFECIRSSLPRPDLTMLLPQ